MFEKTVARNTMLGYNEAEQMFYKFNADVCSGGTDVGTFGNATSLAE